MRTIARLLVAGAHALGRLLGSWVIACIAVCGLTIAGLLVTPDIWDATSPSIPADGVPLEVAAAPGELINLRFTESEINPARSMAQAKFIDVDREVTLPIGLHLDSGILNGLLVAPHVESADSVLDGTIWGTLESDLGQRTSFEHPFRIRVVRDSEPKASVEAYDSLTAAGTALFVLDFFAIAVTALTYHVWSPSRSAGHHGLDAERTDRELNS